MRIGRRFFLGAGLGSVFFLRRQLQKAIASQKKTDSCKVSDIKGSQSAIGIPDGDIHIWIDGHRKKGLCQVAVLTTFAQTKESYVRKIVLTSGEKKTLGVRYITPDMKTHEGYPAYAIFSHVDLRYSKRYFIMVAYKSKNQEKIYRYTLEKGQLNPQLFQGSLVPLKLTKEFQKTHKGRIFSSYYFPLHLIKSSQCQRMARNKPRGGCYGDHFPLVKIRAIGTREDFVIDISFNHPDIHALHYIRYLIITDPVGRLISIFKRTFGDYRTLTASLRPLSSEQWQKQWNLSPEKIGHIYDCPYLMVFTENVKEGLFQTIVWLH